VAKLTLEGLKGGDIARQYEIVTLPPPHPEQSAEPVEARIRRMFAADWLAFRDSLTDKEGNPIKGRTDRSEELQVAFCWVDDDGKRMLADRDIDCEWWRKCSPAFVVQFIREVRDYNLTGFELLGAERKNSSGSTGSDLPTELPPDSESQSPTS